MSEHVEPNQSVSTPRKAEPVAPLYRFGRALLRPFFKLLYLCKYVGRENLPSDGRCVLCSNHFSYLDPIFLALSQNRQIHFMAKAELFHNKFFGFIIRKLGAFPVERGKRDNEAMSTTEHLLQQERVVGIFIEGTRSKDGNFLKPKNGAAMLAYGANAPIVPVCITCKGGGKPALFKRTVVRWGKPVMPREFGIVEGSGHEIREASRQIMGMIAALRDETIREDEAGV